MTTDREYIDNFKSAVRFIELQRRALVEARANPSAIENLSSVIRHLHSLSEFQILRLSGSNRTTAKAHEKKKLADIKRFQNMTLDDIQMMLNDLKTTRSELENIATERFQVPKGSLRSQGNSEQLREKVSILVQNEKSHEAINAVAKELKF